MVNRRSPALRTIVALVVISTLAATLFGIVVARWDSPTFSSTEGTRPSAGPAWGPAQVAGARASLTAHRGPASGPTPTFSVGTYTWSNLTPIVGTHPSSRYVSAMTWDAHDGYVLLFGGSYYNASVSRVLGDTWTYLNGTWTNITNTVVGSPPPLYGAGLAYDPPQGAVILFGGAPTTTTADNETYSYSHGVWTNITTLVHAAPSPRVVPSMVWDSTAGEMLLTGGIAANGRVLPGTWVFSSSDVWSNITGTAPLHALLYTPNLADDPADHGVLAASIMSYSGTGTAPFYPGTFLFTGGAWQNLTGTLAREPPLVYLGSMAYVSAAMGDLLVTGLLVNRTGAFEPGQAVWEFHGGAWTNISSTVGAGPEASAGAGFAFVPFDESMIVLGGANTFEDHTLDQVWALSAPPAVNVSSNVSASDVGVPVALSSVVTQGLSPTTLSWSLGNGATSAASSLNATYSLPGVYTVTLTARDSLGHSGSDSISLSIYADPTASITVSPASPEAGAPATLVANVSGGTPPLTYSWTLGDGSIASSSIVTHAYARAGAYAVTLHVADRVGKSTVAAATVTVASGGGTGSNSSQGSGSTVDLSSGVGLLLLVGLVVMIAVAIVLALLLVRRRAPPGPPPGSYIPPPP